MNERDETARQALSAYFSENGMLLCNESSELPYLDLVGGNWNAIVSLMERGEVCYSRLYRGRVTYLSRALYYAVKPYRQRLTHLDEPSRRLLEFMRAAGEVSAEEMQAACLLEKKAQTNALNQLVSELFATVSRRDVTIHDCWCTFRYCLAETWEQKQFIPTPTNAADARQLLSRQLTKLQIDRILL